jgi:hypothetical protein
MNKQPSQKVLSQVQKVIGMLRVKIVFRARIVKIGLRTINAAAIRIAKITITIEELELPDVLILIPWC